MYVAKCNFDAGKGLQFKKGDNVSCDATTAETLLEEGLIEKVEPVNESPAQETNSTDGVPGAAPTAPVVAAAHEPKKKGKKG